MKIYVDADACPVVAIVEQIAKEYEIPVTLLCDTNENIDRMLMERHLAKKARNAKKKHHLKGPSKRTDEDDRRFAESFTRLVEIKMKEDKNERR